MCNTREKHRPFELLKWDLIRYWARVFNSSYDGIWNVEEGINGQGEGACVAEVEMKDGTTHSGEFNSFLSQHAEMNVIFKYKLQNRSRDVERLEISSPPCPCCSVVLKRLGFSTKVYTREVPIRRALSYNMSENDFKKVLTKLVPINLRKDALYYNTNGKNYVYSLFASGMWYDLAKAHKLV